MKKEKSKGWLEFRAKAGAWFRRLGGRLKRSFASASGRTAAWAADSFRLEKGAAAESLKNGLFLRNPLLVLALGVTCALGATAQLKSAAAMGGCTLAVLLCSSLLISLTRNVLPEPVRKVSGLLIIGTFTSAAGLLLQVLAPNRAQALGIYLPLIAVNCLLLTRTESIAAHHTPGYALLDALSAGVGYALALLVLGAVREALGSGSLWGVPLFGGKIHPALLLAAPCGGFLLLGGLSAAVQWLKNRVQKGGDGA